MINVKKLNPEAIIPTRNKTYDAGLDLYALESVFLGIGTTTVVKTGVAIQIPEGYVGKIEDRSGLAAKGLRTGAGVIDAGYAGEVGVVLHNLTNKSAMCHWEGSSSPGYNIKKGDRIAQLLIYKIETPEVNEVEELWTSERGAAGYGSSGQ